MIPESKYSFDVKLSITRHVHVYLEQGLLQKTVKREI